MGEKTVIAEMRSDEAKANVPRNFIPRPRMLLMMYRPANHLLGDRGLYSVQCGHSAAQQHLIRCCGTRTRHGDLLRDRAVTRTICRRASAGAILRRESAAQFVLDFAIDALKLGGEILHQHFQTPLAAVDDLPELGALMIGE